MWRKVSLVESLPYWKFNNGYSLRSPEFHAAVEKYYPIEYWVHEIYGCLPLIWNEDGLYNSVGDIISHVEVDFPVTDVTAALKSFPHNIGVVSVSWRRSSFKPEEVSVLEMVSFRLPESWELYAESLNKKHRADLVRVSRQIADAGCTWHMGISEQTLNTAISWFEKRWENAAADETDPIYKYWYKHAVNLVKALWYSGVGDFWELRDNEGTLIAVNCGEKAGEVYYDYWSARHPDFDRGLSLGKYVTAKAIQSAIAMNCKEYDLGYDMPYKRVYMPKDAELKHAHNYLALHSPTTFADIEPPYFLDGKLITDGLPENI